MGVLACGVESLVQRIRHFIAREQEFTRDASHELRTPLAVIRSAGECLAAEPALSERGRQRVDCIHRSAAQFEQTVATLLTLARQQVAGSTSEPARVLPVLERMIVEQSGLIEHKPVTLDFRVAADATLPVPTAVLHILMSNLVGNAFAYSEAGEVRIDMEAGTWRIRNDGHPLVTLLGNTLCEPFAKRDGSAGFGLGLAIVRRLCDQHALVLGIHADASATVASVGPRPVSAP